jgi:uncharacterized coiled-coil protein SlyX
MTEEIEAELGRQLTEKWQVVERPFTSHAPLVGPLIVRLRRLWNDVSTTWYVRPLVQQQNEYNHLLLQSNHLLLQSIQQLVEVDGELDGRLTAADHDQTDLRVQVAELVTAVNQMNRRLAAIEARLDQAEPLQ